MKELNVLNITSYVFKVDRLQIILLARSMFERKTVGEQRLRAIIPLEYISHKI